MNTLAAELSLALPALKTNFHCEHCGLLFPRHWIYYGTFRGVSTCLLCKSYHGPVSRSKMIRDAEWVYVQSGTNLLMSAFYEEYLYEMHRWANAHQLPYTQDDVACEQEWRTRAAEMDNDAYGS